MKNTDLNTFSNSDLEEIHNLAAHKNFLGREFLTWLWFFVESDEQGRFEIKLAGYGKQKANIWLEDRIVLTSKVGLSHDLSISGGNPSQCQEAALALSQGKHVSQLKIGLDLSEAGAFHFTLSGEDLCPKSIQLPGAKEEADDSALEQRVRSTIHLTQSIDFLIEKFMNERSSNLWETNGIESIRNWIKTRAERFAKLRGEVIH